MSLQRAATTQQIDPATADRDAQESLLRLGLTAEQQQQQDTQDATTNPQINTQAAQASSSPTAQHIHLTPGSTQFRPDQRLSHHLSSGGSVDKADASVPFTKEESPIFSLAHLAQLDFFRLEAAISEVPLPDPAPHEIAASESHMGEESKLILQSDMNGTLAWGEQFAEEVVIPSLQGPARISAYAKLEFPDGEFYMNTYSIILGRDLQATRAAIREAAQQELAEDGNVQEPTTAALANPEEGRYKKSIVSETGGILLGNGESEAPERPRRSRKASKKSKSTGSSSHHPSRRNSQAQPNGDGTSQPAPQPTKLIGSVTAGAAPVDPASLRPSPHDCPVLGIHPPAPSDLSGYKTISRRHVRISYSSRKRLFEAQIMGRNGAFIDDEFCPHKAVVPLKSGSRLQIGGIVVTFVLPDVAIGQTGAEEMYEDDSPRGIYREGGKEMSFDFEHSPRHGVLDGTSEEESNSEEHENSNSENGEDDGGNGVEDEMNGDDNESGSSPSETMRAYDEDNESEAPDEDPARQQEELERKIALDLLSQKKRGPGRPPKNGIMSKREQQLVKKAAAQAHAKAQSQAQSQEQGKESESQAPIMKKKVGRPRKHPVPDPSVQVQKRKYTKRKPKDPIAVQDGGSSNETKEKKLKKPKRPRSPTPELHREDFTPEQLERPKQGYVQILYEVLSKAKGGALPLSRIYRAMMLKYPYFYFDAGTNGWQSSVRHNLTQNAAFDKVKVEGEGMWWTTVPGVSIEKEKKQKISSPSDVVSGLAPPQTIYQAPYIMHGPPYHPGIMPPPGYQVAPHMHSQYRPGIYMPHQAGASQYPPGSHMPPNSYPPQFIAPMHTPMLAPPSTVAYSSPYAPKPPQQQEPQQQPQQPSHTNGQPPPGQQPPTQASAPAPSRLPPQAYQQSPPNPQRSQPKLPGHVKSLVAVFKDAMLKTMTHSTSNAEEIIDCAINRVLGMPTVSSSSLEAPEAASKIESLMVHLRNMLEKVRGAPPPRPAQPPTQPLVPPQQQTATTHPPTLNQNGPQQPSTNATIKSPRPASTSFEATKPPPSVPRPSLSGQSKKTANSISIPRPSMHTSMRRTDSGSPANPGAMLNASSAAVHLSVGSGATAVPENAQIAGQKRPLEDTSDNREAKKFIAANAPPVKA